MSARRDVDRVPAALADAVAYGVDLSLLRELLRLTPAERLARLDAAAAALAELRGAVRQAAAGRRGDR